MGRVKDVWIGFYEEAISLGKSEEDAQTYAEKKTIDALSTKIDMARDRYKEEHGLFSK